MTWSSISIASIRCSVLHIPTDAPEADGTIAWDATDMLLVEIGAGGKVGLGYSYCAPAAAGIVREVLAPCLRAKSVFDIPALWVAMVRAVRNLGWRGICANAISAVDLALWDLKARLLDLPLASLLGQQRQRVPIYGSGGFTTYSDQRLAEQLGGWVREDGCRFVKMKIGSQAEREIRRAEIARDAIGDAELFVDANGAYARKQALALAEALADLDVTWFEEPVSSDDLEGLRLLRDRAPSAMEITAGEYGYEPFYFRRMLDAGAIDVLQADATRCGGITGFLKIAALAEAYAVPLSAHTAPAAHLAVACAASGLRHIEWFHDHVRAEHLIFDGAPEPEDGAIQPDLTRPGNGLVLKRAQAERLAA